MLLSVDDLHGGLTNTCPECKPVLIHCMSEFSKNHPIRVVSRDWQQFDHFRQRHGLPLRLVQRVAHGSDLQALSNTTLLVLPGSAVTWPKSEAQKNPAILEPDKLCKERGITLLTVPEDMA